MSVEVAEALYEAVFAHPGTWTEDEYFALPEMPTKVELVGGEYRVAAQSVDGVLRTDVPWPFEADLRTLGRGRR